MPQGYVNLTHTLAEACTRLAHLERYIGIKQQVDYAHAADQDIQSLMPVTWVNTAHLLWAQHNSRENGLYIIDSHGRWQPFSGEVEIGNIVSCRQPLEKHVFPYYELLAEQDGSQIWRPFELSDLIRPTPL